MEKSVWIRRKVLNSDEIFDHFADQKILKRLIGRSRMFVSLSYTQRQLNWDDISLKEAFYIHDHTSNDSNKIKLYGKNRVLAQELDAPQLIERNKNLSDIGATFFELTDYKPHIALDYNLDEEIDWNEIKPFREPVVLKSEKISEAPLNFREKIRYRILD